MASVATDRQGSTKPAKPPISTHPLFPAIVAIWFAALLGLGSLVLPAALLERAAMATGIAAVIPAAAPPFGLTARVLIALAFTLAGTIAGLLIARRVARAHAPRPAPRFSQDRSEPVSRPPINAHEELGHDGFDGQMGGRRRSLAIMEDEGPSEYLDRARLPGAQDLSWPAPDERIDAGDPLELTSLAEEIGEESPSCEDPGDEPPGPPADEDDARPFDGPTRDEIEETAGRQIFDPPVADEVMADEDSSDRVVFESAGFEREAPERQEFIPGEPEEFETESEPVETGGEMSAEDAFVTPAAHHSAPGVDPESESAEPIDALPFSPPSLAGGKQLETAQAHNDAGDAPEEPQFNAEPGGKEMAEKDMPEKPTKDWSETPPEELGLVQLAERLGSALEKHREYVVARAAVRSAPQRQAPSGFDVAEPDEAALAKAAYFGGGQAASSDAQEENPASEARMDAAPKAETPEQVSQRTAGAARSASQDDGEDERQLFQPDPPAPTRKAYQPFAGFSPAAGSPEDYGNDENDEDEIEELAASFSLPIDRKTSRPLFVRPDEVGASAPPATPAPQVAEEQDEETAEDPGAELSADLSELPDRPQAPVPQGYGSLLGIKNPFKEGGEKFVRIDEEEFETHESDDAFEPTVVFPGQEERSRSDASADESKAVDTGAARPFDPPHQSATQPKKPAAQRTGSNDTDEMLREALLNLQRTSGAA